MHMGDALISPAIGLSFHAISAAGIAWAVRQLGREERREEKLPLMGVLAAFVFAAQMINFSIPGTGSSGHLGGGLLLAVLLGAPAAFIAMTAILMIQCLVFMDGGLLALGCNIFNLAFWPCVVGSRVFQTIYARWNSRTGLLVASIAAAIFSLEPGALSVAIQTVASGRSELPFGLFSAFMLGIHLPIAIIEGFVTATVIGYVWALRPGTQEESSVHGRAGLRAWRPVLAGLAIAALLVGGVLSWFASASPDGLEWSAEKVYGSAELPEKPSHIQSALTRIQAWTAVLPDYAPKKALGKGDALGEAETESWPAPDHGTTLAGVAGSLLTAFVILIFVGTATRIFSRRDANT